MRIVLLSLITLTSVVISVACLDTCLIHATSSLPLGNCTLPVKTNVKNLHPKTELLAILRRTIPTPMIQLIALNLLYQKVLVGMPQIKEQDRKLRLLSQTTSHREKT
jgi:hypothetical protein